MVAIDLSDLNALVAVWNAFLQAFLPIILIGAFIGFVILIAGGKQLLGKLSFAFPSGSNKLAKPKRRKATIVKLGTLMMLAMMLFAMAGPGMAAVAVNGNLSCGTTQIFANTPVTFTAYNLDASTAYAIYYDATAIINWTSAASPIDMVVTIEATGPSSGNSVDAVLYSAAETVETLTLYVAEVSDFIPIGFLIGVGVAFMIIGVVALVVVSIVKKRG